MQTSQAPSPPDAGTARLPAYPRSASAASAVIALVDAEAVTDTTDVSDDDLMSTGEAALLLGVHRTTVARYITEGRLPARRLPGGQFRVRREDVLKLLREVEDEFGADAT
jgi:excisionase family DNA binding protein